MHKQKYTNPCTQPQPHAHAHVHQVRPEDFCQSSEFSDAAVATTLLRVPADWFGAGLLIHPCMRLPGREGEFTLSVYADVEVAGAIANVKAKDKEVSYDEPMMPHVRCSTCPTGALEAGAQRVGC